MKLKSNEPFWLVKSGLLHTYPSLDRDLDTELLVVGGGITGSLIGYQCVKEGYKTVLVDRREICNGSTSATTSMLQYEIDTQLCELIEMIGEEGALLSYRACYDSIDTLGKLVREIRSDCGFDRKESLYFAAYKKDLGKLEKEFACRKEYGFPVSWLDSGELEKKYGLSGVPGAILNKQGGSIDAFRFAHDMHAYNAGKGLEIFDKTELAEVNHHSRGVTAFTEEGFRIRAKKIIYCNGFESVEIIKDDFVKLLSTYAIVSEPREGAYKALDNTLFWNTASPYLYMRTTDDGRFLIGGEDEDFRDPAKRDRLIGRKTEKLEKEVSKLFPGYPFRTDFSWAGTFGETKDGLPYIGRHPDFPSAYFVLGFGGNGITFSVIGMEMISAFLTGKSHPLDLYFRFRR